MKINVKYLISVISSLAFVIAGYFIVVNTFPGIDKGQKPEIVTAKILNTQEKIMPQDDSREALYNYGYRIPFEAKIIRGDRKGTTVSAVQVLVGSPRLMPKEVSKGDTVLLNNYYEEWFFINYLRTDALLGLGIFFILCVVFFGRKKGFNTVLSLGLTCGIVFAVFIPSVLSGANVYIMSFTVCIYTIIMTLLLVAGINKKSLCAAAGCISGLVVTVILTLVMEKVLLLTGVLDENSRYIAGLPIENRISLSAIMFAGIIIGAIGAIMDVAMSISSSLWELKEKAPKASFKSLFNSGINIGRDIMGTMANTLVLAYIGSSLSSVLIISVYSNSLISLLNTELIVVEILRALVGSLGILFAMPLTALFCSFIYVKKKM